MKKRREVIYISSAVLMPGCVQKVGLPEGKRLEIYLSSILKSEKNWVADLKIKNQTNLEGEKGTFHEVRVVGYSKQENHLCQKSLGTVRPNESIKLRLSCRKVPAIVTCKTRESPCDRNVNIEKIIHTGGKSKKWQTGTKDCKTTIHRTNNKTTE